MCPRVAGVCLVLLAVVGCTSEKDPGPPEPSPQQSPSPHGGTPDPPVALARDVWFATIDFSPGPRA